VLTLFSRTRRRTAALRPYYGRLAVERLEGRDAPSSLDVTVLPSSATDLTTASETAVVSPVAAPSPQLDTSTVAVGTANFIPVPAAWISPQAPRAGDTLTPSADIAALPALDPPADLAYTTDGAWNYTVIGTVTDPNPGSLTVEITVDDVREPSAQVKPLVNPDGTATGKGTFTTTFPLAVCTSATNSRRYGTAVATDGTRVSAVTMFFIDQRTVTTSGITAP
jgi:hypothetical protein